MCYGVPWREIWRPNSTLAYLCLLRRDTAAPIYFYQEMQFKIIQPVQCGSSCGAAAVCVLGENDHTPAIWRMCCSASLFNWIIWHLLPNSETVSFNLERRKGSQINRPRKGGLQVHAYKIDLHCGPLRVLIGRGKEDSKIDTKAKNHSGTVLLFS